MTLKRPQFLPVVMVVLTALAANACGSDAGDDDDDDDDDANAGKGMVLSGGTAGSGGTMGGSGGKGGSSGAGGTSFVTGGSGGSMTGGSGGTTTGGSDGSGGSGNSSGAPPAAGGTGGAGGSTGGTGAGMGGSAGTPGDSPLGGPCAGDGDCASGLVCLTADSTTFGGGGPPHGMCTTPCDEDAVCTALDPGAYCVPFDEAQTVAYCLLGCTTGEAGVPKCQSRADFACGLLGTSATTAECTTSDDCTDTQLCNEETSLCGEIITGCVPMCGGDYDCESGQYCDFLSGLCVAGEAEGLDIGAACDPNAATNPCAGFCQFLDEEGTEGVCAGFCTVKDMPTGCGWDGTGTAEAACLYGTRLSPPDDLALGDLAICGSLCDCNDDCQASLQRCVDESTDGLIMQIWGRAGYCRPLLEDETEADTIACN